MAYRVPIYRIIEETGKDLHNCKLIRRRRTFLLIVSAYRSALIRDRRVTYSNGSATIILMILYYRN